MDKEPDVIADGILVGRYPAGEVLILPPTAILTAPPELRFGRWYYADDGRHSYQGYGLSPCRGKAFWSNVLYDHADGSWIDGRGPSTCP